MSTAHFVPVRLAAIGEDCPHCGGTTCFTSNSSFLFKDSRDYGPQYYCESCHAKVGTHSGSKTPLGTLAIPMLAHLRKKGHSLLDAVNKENRAAGIVLDRDRLYAQLARKMGIHKDNCHFGMFDMDQAQEAIYVLNQILNPT